ncbi:IpaD/SipD/SspD family type III secretion system needle tip protein [Burkholderia sp. BE17]|uniref:IpaD/SipD/SspD family type III secretion system needle tip protein n=1 Tax=Burkholderia sp. BE17 TaxID=2656644 RepID=UPI00128B2993|nr:IpaD/SipD/SspD family type III secretion system needle tip protein [Burkholderia sp. BE17]MPV70215.1 IpaD/SipD/SspD family type III secretion system needle tip protein [Burkholderia sp. BE17]
MRIDQCYTQAASTWRQTSGSDVPVREGEVRGAPASGSEDSSSAARSKFNGLLQAMLDASRGCTLSEAGGGQGGRIADEASDLRITLKGQGAQRDNDVARLIQAFRKVEGGVPESVVTRLMSLASDADFGASGDTAKGDELPDPTLQGLIDLIEFGKGAVGDLAKIVETLTNGLERIVDVLSTIQDAIKAKDDKTMSIDGKKIRAQLQNLIDSLPVVQLSPGTNVDAVKKLFGDAISIDKNGRVTINPDHLEKMRDSLPDQSDAEWDLARFNAWNTGFSAQKSSIENDVQTAAQKYSQQNAAFDNLVRMLSSSISGLTDTNKSFLQF